MMKVPREERRALCVGVAHEDPAVAGGLCAALRRRGHSVRIVAEGEDLLGGAALDAVVLDVDIEGSTGLDQLERLRERGSRAHAVLVASMPDLEVCRRALRLGAAELIPAPFSIDEVVAVIEDAPCEDPGAADGEQASRSYPCTREGILHAVRDVGAFAVRAGLGPAARARLCSATHELGENARQHAYPSRVGAVRVRAQAHGREAVVEISDRGVGFDAIAAQLDGVGAPISGDVEECRGLTRVAALVEDLRLESSPRGTRARIAVEGAPVALAEEPLADISDADWLSPDQALAVLRAAREGLTPDMVGVSPALAVSIGRLLAGRTEVQAAQAALWS